MSEYQNTHDDDVPRFEPWLGMIAASVLPLGAAVYLPSAFPVLMVLTVLLFVSGLIMLRLQTVRRAREQNRAQSTIRPEVRPPMAQLQVEDR